MKILSIDDSSIIRKIVRATISVIGYDFLGAEDAEDALNLLETEHSDISLILLDWNMPGVNGYELLQILKQDERYKEIPVMMVTTETDKSNIIMAIKGGAINYLTKPFSNEDLLTKIMECIGGDDL